MGPATRLCGSTECTLYLQHHLCALEVDRYNKIKCFIDYQRKSGDASTFFGNTLVTMFTLATAINMHNVFYAVFAGDDSLIFSKCSFECDIDKLAYIFNLKLNY